MPGARDDHRRHHGRPARRGADAQPFGLCRQSRLEPVRVDLNDLVRETRNWAGRAMPANILTETTLLAGLWPVQVDPDATVAALLNLLVNARDAMPQGGRLTLDLEPAHRRGLSAGTPRGCARGAMCFWRSATRARGSMPRPRANLRALLLDQAPANNSGLGLSMVLGFIKQSGGSVRVCSEPGVGQAFELYFPPIVRQPLPREVQAPWPCAWVPAPVLVAEDEADLLKLTVTLEAAGAHVTACAWGCGGGGL